MDAGSLVRLTAIALAAVAGVALLIRAWRYRPVYNAAVGAERERPAEQPASRSVSRPTPAEADSLVWVALSGGGTRAAALGWKVLETLAEVDFPVTRNGTTRLSKLGHEIDFISGISGGSFAAAAWCLARDRPERFRRSFLSANVQAAIWWRLALPPWRTLRLLSPEYDRINVAAELYDERVFDRSTFADLGPRPRLLLHATHLALGSRFSFTPEDFALLDSDLGGYPIGYACAASSAFPVLLSPLTLLNHGRRLDPEQLKRIDRIYRRAARNRRSDVEEDLIRRGREFYNEKGNRYIHLADGGLVDNQGLQAILDAFVTNGYIQRRLNDIESPLRRLILINVNAGTQPDEKSAKRRRSPGFESVLLYTMVTSMDILSAKRWGAIQNVCADRYKPVIDGAPDLPYAGMEEPYTIEISFRNLRDDALRRKCQRLPTSFRLSSEQLGWIDEAAPQLVREDPHFQRLQRVIERQLDGGA